MNTSTEHILQCNQSVPLADVSGMNENAVDHISSILSASHLGIVCATLLASR